MRRFLRVCRLITVNLVVFALLLGGIELYYRRAHPGPAASPYAEKNGIWQMFNPYVMFTSAPGPYKVWHNDLTNETYPSTIKTNSLGFNDSHEFSLTKPYIKGPHERVVLFTSGSVGWGVGATATDQTIAGRIQYHLNNAQHDVKYTVVNMSMGSWIAIQESIGLQLWGEGFDPDWVVVMDGFNDAEVGCGYSQGVGNPLYFATIKGYVDGYLFSKARPVFYRGWLDNELVKYSVAYRVLTGKDYIENKQVFDATSTEAASFRRQIMPTTMGESRAILDFYLKTQKSMLHLFPRAAYLLSTQPTVNDFRGDFVDVYDSPSDSQEHRRAMAKRESDLEVYLTHYQGEPCRAQTHAPSFTYVFVNGALRLERLADQERAAGMKVEYHNTGTLLPNDREQRTPFFIDSAHMTDKGADVLGRFYAERIWARDGNRADPGSESAARKSIHPGVSVMSATYGANCGALPGNVTAAVRSVCDGRKFCDYVVDVNVLGDPMPQCRKSFVVDYQCDAESPPLRKELAAEAGLGSHALLCR